MLKPLLLLLLCLGVFLPFLYQAQTQVRRVCSATCCP
jgi:hypothetical protein